MLAVVSGGKGMSKERKKSRRGGTMDIEREAAYVIGLARERLARFVTLGPLVFFSTAGGDAGSLLRGLGPAVPHRGRRVHGCGLSGPA
jgi:hypothetical protein